MTHAFAASAAALAVFLTGLPAFAGDVRVTVSGVRAANGPLYVGLQTREQFMQNAGSYGEIVASPAPGAVSVTLHGVAPGEYSVSVWHDIDGDGVFDMGPDGKPIDGWAMIDGASLRGAPTFDQVSFKKEDASIAIDVDMIYAD
ncbi:MAG TPA: hypothetical protein DDZ68_03260 [Parvularcula sp.]|nr:hypothetical protein [Parvularcula sp.]